MSGRGGKLAIAFVGAALFAGVGFGAYTHLPTALAGQSQGGAGAEPTPSVSASPTESSTPTTSPSTEANPSTEPSAPPQLRDTPPATQAPATGPCARTGPTQLVVERYLAAHPQQYGSVTVDGKQSPADCAAIRKFQLRYGVQPSIGYAGPVSGQVATRLSHVALDRCAPATELTICVDLTSQTMWVVRGGAIVLGPTTVRTGRAGMATPAGHYTIHDKKRDTISSLFPGVHLPYWERFNGGMGFHQTPSYLYDGNSPGSHGCINLLRRDAIALYGMTSTGTPVHIFGAKPA